MYKRQAAGGSVPPSPVPSLSAAPAGTFPFAQLRELLDRTVARGIPGVVLGIATPQGAWLAASGVADIAGGEVMTASHALRVAQASETFTAALVWSLVEERRLHLDDTVDSWLFPRSVPCEGVLPGEPGHEARPRPCVPRGDVITVRMLLNHTSGLSDHTESARYLEVMARNPSHPWSAAEVLSIARTQPLKFVPGTGFAYSSTNDYLLGLIAEAVTRRPVESLVRNRFFAPAGMARTSLTPSGNLPLLSTPGYTWLDRRHEPSSTRHWSFSGEWTAGGATSTALDMLAWASRLAGGKVLRPRTLEEAWTVEPPSMMACGFEATTNTLGYRRVGRTGAKPGTTTDLLLYPDQGWAMFVGLNVSDSRSAPTLPTRRIVREVREAAELLLGWNSPPTYAATVAKNRAALREMLATLGIPSASVALVDGERVVWSETFGAIDERGTRPGPDTMFCIGSVSKVLAAAAVMKLVDQGKLDLDAPLDRYLPDFRMTSPEYSRITVRMLLDHSAGFGGADYRNMFSYAPLASYSAQVQAGLAAERLKHSPGYLSVYCNDCVSMVEPLVRAASGGASYTDFVKTELLGPLGMANSRYTLEPFPKGSFAPGLVPGSSPQKPVFDFQEFAQPYASGGLYTTPEDMSRLAVMLLDGGLYGGLRILSEQAVAEMGRDQTRDLLFNPVPTFARGLGWDNVAHSGLAAVGVRGWHKKGGTMVYETD